MSVEKYIPDFWKAEADHMREILPIAQDEMVNPPPSVRFKRFPLLDAMTGGLRPYEFSILCGGTGTGKTTLCANLSLDFAEQGVPQFVASVETGHSDYVKRMVSAKSEQDFNTGDPVPVDQMVIFNMHHGKTFVNAPLWLSLYDNRTTVENLMADMASMVHKNGVKVAIIDNLNFFLEITRASDQLIEMDRVIHELIIFCKQVPIHVLMIMHPKKTESGRIESEFDIKGSSTAVQEAHNVILFNRPHPELLKTGVAFPSDRELMLAKMRRRGKYVRKRLVIRSKNSVSYHEGPLV